jgi:hypothetical protein
MPCLETSGYKIFSPATEKTKKMTNSSESRLYRHVRECIADFLTLPELATLMSVNKEWQDVIVRMPCSRLNLLSKSEDVRLDMMHSRLHRHIIGIMGGDVLTTMEMSLYFFRMPHLKWLELTLAEDIMVKQLPTQLKILKLEFSEDDDLGFQSVIDAIGKLQLLRELQLVAKSSVEDVDLSPLANAPALIQLVLDVNGIFTDAQTQQLHLLSRLRRLELSNECSLRVLLVNPQSFQKLRSLQCTINSDEEATFLCMLPSLKHLKLWSADCTHIDFVHHLPKLVTLLLDVPQSVDTPRIIKSLQSCTKLHTLTLDGRSGFDITSEQLASCVQHMPQLQELELLDCKALFSLSFLSAGTLCHTLTILSIGDCDRRIPLTELHKVNALRSLLQLYLHAHTFDAEFKEYAAAAYTPPSVLLPQLTDYTYVEFVP